MTDWMEIDARLTALEAKVQEQQDQIDAMKDRTTQCDCCGGYNGEHYPNCTDFRRQQGLDELVRHGQAMGEYEPEPTNFEAHDCPHWQPEQEGWPEIERRSMDRRTMDFYDRERAAEIYAKAGITPTTSDDELAAMARMGRMRKGGLELLAAMKGQVPQDLYYWMRDLLLGEDQ